MNEAKRQTYVELGEAVNEAKRMKGQEQQEAVSEAKRLKDAVLERSVSEAMHHVEHEAMVGEVRPGGGWWRRASTSCGKRWTRPPF